MECRNEGFHQVGVSISAFKHERRLVLTSHDTSVQAHAQSGSPPDSARDVAASLDRECHEKRGEHGLLAAQSMGLAETAKQAVRRSVRVFMSLPLCPSFSFPLSWFNLLASLHLCVQCLSPLVLHHFRPLPSSTPRHSLLSRVHRALARFSCTSSTPMHNPLYSPIDADMDLPTFVELPAPNLKHAVSDYLRPMPHTV